MTDDVPNGVLRRFADLFSGYEKAHGRFRILGRKANGKVEGRAITVDEFPDEPAWAGHLTGKGDGVGIIPLRADNTCLFGCIDVDVKEFPSINPRAEAVRVAQMGLPLVVCQSKSGGAHLYLFLAIPTEASEVRRALHSMAAQLGFGGAEVFPKQETRTSEIDTGNWINTPYYNNGEPSGKGENGRVGLDDAGDPLALAEFLDWAEAHRTEDISSYVAPPSSGGLFSDGPPCLETWAQRGGFPEGGKNIGLFNVGVYSRKAHPDDWESKFAEYNPMVCKPAASAKDMVGLTRSAKRKDYHYTCKQEPLKSVCNRALCMTRRFGIGTSAEDSGVEITGLTKYLSDPVIWVADVGGPRLQLVTEELITHRVFSRICAEKISRLPAAVNQAKWIEYLRPKIEAAEEIPVPDDAGEQAQFRLYVMSWLTGPTQAQGRDELLLDKPWREGGHIYFLSTSLKKKLDGDRVRYRSMHHVWKTLEEMGAKHAPGMTLRGNRFRQPWMLPDPDAQTNLMDESEPGGGGPQEDF